MIKETIVVRASESAAQRILKAMEIAKRRLLTIYENKPDLLNSELKAVFGKYEDLFINNNEKLIQFARLYHKDDELQACLLCEFIKREAHKQLRKEREKS